MEKIKVGLATAGCKCFPAGEVGTGHRPVQIVVAGPSLPQDLSAASPSTPWQYLKGKKTPTNKNKIWLSFGETIWGKQLILNLQDLTFIAVKKSLRNRNLPFFLCVCGIFCKVRAPHQVRIAKTSREGHMAKPGPLAGLQLFTRLPSPMAITCSVVSAHTPSPFNFSCR